MSTAMHVRRTLSGVVGGVLMLSAGQVQSQLSPQLEAKVTDPHFKLAPGYLKQADLPDSLLLLGAPPAKDSAAFARDEEARQAAAAIKESARWLQARQDADLVFPRPAQNYSCALGVKIEEASTPVIYRMMQRLLTDAGLSTYGVKNKYQRVRPFALHQEGTCTPGDEDLLRNDGSYPSGHTAAGWAWALVLAQINPERSNELLARGLSFGQSRVVCNAHWQSDVDAGRVMGAATVARLQSEAAFQADILAAQQELARAKTIQGNEPLNCAVESAALS
ncbi:MAG: phosphatase PAP2 family protein [Alcaligenes sp.]|nr:phosphatase PAP2 family protein [Alcaligenes sp.]HCA17006.1 acid phosphatase [Alcaligenes faecalis]